MEITIYELLGMVKDGKAPKKIKVFNYIFIYTEDKRLPRFYKMLDQENYLLKDFIYGLDTRVEILEEPTPTQEEINEYTDKFLEVWKPVSKQLDKLFNELIRIYNVLGLNLEDEIEEEKKIPEKLNIERDTPTSNYYIRNEQGTKCALTKHSKMIAETLNQVIDYLKSKGE